MRTATTTTTTHPAPALGKFLAVPPTAAGATTPPARPVRTVGRPVCISTHHPRLAGKSVGGSRAVRTARRVPLLFLVQLHPLHLLVTAALVGPATVSLTHRRIRRSTGRGDSVRPAALF